MKKCTACKINIKMDDFMSHIGREFKQCVRCRDMKRVKYNCECGKQKRYCKEHGGVSFCECGKRKDMCKEHGGGSLCECGKRKDRCKEHGNEFMITIKNMVSNSRTADKLRNQYDANTHIDILFIESLIEDYGTDCYYCNKETQFKEFSRNLISIERINNNIGHSKANCVLCCLNCNNARVGQLN